MKSILSFLIIAIFSLKIFSQISPNSFTPDFQINTENDPSTFIQNDPAIFYNGQDKILTVWKDPRNGNDSYFAQYFDTSGIKIGTNFPVSSNHDIIFGEDNSFLNLNQSITQSQLYGGYSLSGSIFSNDGSLQYSVPIMSSNLPWCGTGWLGITNDAARFNEGYYIVLSFGGSVSLSKLSDDETVSLVEPSNYYFSFAAANVSVATASNGNYAVFSIIGYDFEDDPIGLYVSIFNEQDSIIAADVQLKLFDNQNFSPFLDSDTAPKMISIGKSESFQLFVFEDDSLKVSVFNLDSNGNITGEISEIEIPYTPQLNNSTIAVENFSLTNSVNGKRKLFAGIKEVSYENGSGYIYKYFNTIFDVDSNGVIVGEIITDTTKFNTLSHQPYKINTTDFFTATETGSDIYLSRFENFAIQDSVLINDDQIGSSERASSISIIDESEAMVTWEDELGIAAQKINSNGELLGSKFRTDSKNFIFFSDGSAASIFKSKSIDGAGQLGIKLYDPSLNLISTDTIHSEADYSDIIYTSFKPGDDRFILFFKKDDSLSLSLFNQYGLLENEKLIELPQNYPRIKILPVDQNSFWIFWNEKLQKYSNELQQLSNEISVNFTPALYLGNGNFLTLNFKSNDFIYWYEGQIVDISGAPQSPAFGITIQSEVQPYLLPSGEFLTLFGYSGKFYGKVFNQNGNLIKDQFTVHDNTSGAKIEFTARMWNDTFLFAWSDARNFGNGFDIYGKLYELSDLTEVNDPVLQIPNEFKLFQNYPNPFNPTTKIKYIIPSDTAHLLGGFGGNLVSLKIYDLLGSEVAVILNQQLSPGTHEIEFDGSNLPSGIYFYKLNAGNFSETKKLLLIK